MLAHMRSAHSGKRHSVDATELILYQRFRVAGDVLVAFVTRRRCNQNQRRVCIADDDASVLSNDSPSWRKHADPRLKLQRSFDAGRFAILAAQDERACFRAWKARITVCFSFDVRFLWGRKTGGETNLAATICGEAQDDQLVHR